jgi:hypothetical protein
VGVGELGAQRDRSSSGKSGQYLDLMERKDMELMAVLKYVVKPGVIVEFQIFQLFGVISKAVQILTTW